MRTQTPSASTSKAAARVVGVFQRARKASDVCACALPSPGPPCVRMRCWRQLRGFAWRFCDNSSKKPDRHGCMRQCTRRGARHDLSDYCVYEQACVYMRLCAWQCLRCVSHLPLAHHCVCPVSARSAAMCPLGVYTKHTRLLTLLDAPFDTRGDAYVPRSDTPSPSIECDEPWRRRTICAAIDVYTKMPLARMRRRCGVKV
jgi:hypothetical protein